MQLGAQEGREARDVREEREGRDPKFEVPGSGFDVPKTSNFEPRTLPSSASPACLARPASRARLSCGGLLEAAELSCEKFTGRLHVMRDIGL